MYRNKNRYNDLINKYHYLHPEFDSYMVATSDLEEGVQNY